MKHVVLTLIALTIAVVSFAASGDVTVNGTTTSGAIAVKFSENELEKTDTVYKVLSSGTETPGSNSYDISISPPTTGKINLTYEIETSVDIQHIMIGFNDNLTATGRVNLYSVGSWPSVAGKLHMGYGRIPSVSSGQYNSYDILTSGNLIMMTGHVISEYWTYWTLYFDGYLKYPSPQQITKINIKCQNGSTVINKIKWKVVAIP